MKKKFTRLTFLLLVIVAFNQFILAQNNTEIKKNDAEKRQSRALENRENINRHRQTIVNQMQTNPNQGFMGVTEKYAVEKEIEGLRIKIVPQSGAELAGLKTDDVILELNKKPINRFSDVSAFMKTTKADDKVIVTFQRNGILKTTTVTLGKQPENNNHYVVKEKEKDACLGVYSTTFTAEGQRGSVIRDFTVVSAAQEVAMQKGDVILSINNVRVKSHQEVWDEIAKYKPQDRVNVAFIRENAPKQVVATLKACKPRNGVDEETITVVPKEAKAAENSSSLNISPLKLEAYSASPNPTSDMVTVTFQGAAVPTNISFYNAAGKLLLQQNISDFNGNFNQRFDLHQLAHGIVVVKVQQDNKVFSNKIIVE
jgi:PDZ domain-containing secreted protein